jgi:hypothetical protein
MEGEEYAAFYCGCVLGLLPTPVGKRSSSSKNTGVAMMEEELNQLAGRGSAASATEGSSDLGSTGVEDLVFSVLIKNVMLA